MPAMPFDALLKLERRVSHDGLVSIGGNYYSVPDRTRRVVEVHQLPDQIRILDRGPARRRRIRSWKAAGSTGSIPDHRQGVHRRRTPQATRRTIDRSAGSAITSPRRSLAFYQAIGERLADSGGRS